MLMQGFFLNLLQVMVFSKNQPEEEIDEMHSNYSKQVFSMNFYKELCHRADLFKKKKS